MSDDAETETVDYCTYHETVHYAGSVSAVCKLVKRVVRSKQKESHRI